MAEMLEVWTMSDGHLRIGFQQEGLPLFRAVLPAFKVSRVLSQSTVGPFTSNDAELCAQSASLSH